MLSIKVCTFAYFSKMEKVASADIPEGAKLLMHYKCQVFFKALMETYVRISIVYFGTLLSCHLVIHSSSSYLLII